MNIHLLIQLLVVLEECEGTEAVVEELEKVIRACEFEYYGLLRYPRQGIDPRGVVLASRWLLCLLYIGLALLLVALAVQFFRELLHTAENLFELRDVDFIGAALSLVDLALIGGLIILVMVSGYENFVRHIDIIEAEKSIAWLGKLDMDALKLKVATAIVTISGVQLLKAFMDVADVPNDKLLWSVVIHIIFVIAALLIALTDRIGGASH